MSDFDCDRQAKRDFTASTVSYWKEKGKDTSRLAFWEKTKAGTLVPFDSPDADRESRLDVYICYSAVTDGRLDAVLWWSAELKERSYPSTANFFITGGSYLNTEKIEAMKEEPDYAHIWVELYSDGKIRLWNLTHIDIGELPEVWSGIKRYTVKNGPRIRQKRRLLPISKAIEIKRERGWS